MQNHENLPWSSFEHEVWKLLKKHTLDKKECFILAVSGGIDSVVMFKLMQRLKPKAKLIVCHYHHGNAENLSQNLFRDECENRVSELVRNENNPLITYVTEKSDKVLKTENDFREARFTFLRHVQRKNPDSVIVTAHHKDDQLETWLLKLIRGTGVDSLENFNFWNGDILRPLIGVSKLDITQYAEEHRLKWCEDPSNKESSYLRNWIRNEWLPQLEQKLPGSINNISLSLGRLMSEVSPVDNVIEINYEYGVLHNVTKAQFSRSHFLALSHQDQIKTLARVMRKFNLSSFSQGQLEEVKKRLDKNQKELTFMIIGVNWFINAEQVVVQYKQDSTS
ncbi:MAG: tRNA lysidine(34) synthetase TilS [Pseudobdellovibrio sp.]